MRVAVIDVGSNSIKLLVADNGPDGIPVEVTSRTLEVRISRGISSDRPHLLPEGMDRGIEAVLTLANDARVQGADRILAVATSAVRDAANGQEFHDRARIDAGVELRILSGMDEANLIGLGLTTDPALRNLTQFHTFDLGGGSLEFLSFRNREVAFASSMPLGCVRLTEMFVAKPADPLSDEEAQRIGFHVTETIVNADVPLPLPHGSSVVGTGGTLTTVRAIVGARSGLRAFEADPVISVALLKEILETVGPADLEGRKKMKGLSPERADVFPTALVTLITLAEIGKIDSFHHSFRNLRWGVASSLLAGGEPGA
jgi:exopolyphosphatase/guanosine-5'-triphosphate,3'-diphosphate pyrophosphatase